MRAKRADFSLFQIKRKILLLKILSLLRNSGSTFRKHFYNCLINHVRFVTFYCTTHIVFFKTSTYQKNGQNQICRFFWDEQFYSWEFFKSPIVGSENGLFDFVKNRFWWIKPKPLVKNSWLTNLTFIFTFSSEKVLDLCKMWPPPPRFCQMWTFWDPLNPKKWFLRMCLSVCLCVCLSACV